MTERLHLNVGGPRGWSTACGRESANFVDLHKVAEHDDVDCKSCRRSLAFAVSEAYRNARLENDYNFDTAREWAEDMVTCDATLEKHSVDEIEKIMERILL